MLPPFGLWLINLIMSKEFYITSLDNNMNRGTFQGVFAIFLYFLLGRDVRRGQGGTDILPRELRFAAKWLYELCFWFSMPDETVATRLPWLDSSLPRHPCRGISVLRNTILQPLSSFAMRSCGSMPVPSPLSVAHVPYSVAEYKKTRCSRLHLCFYSSVLLFCYYSLLCCSALFLLLKPASWLSRGHFSRPAFSAP